MSHNYNRLSVDRGKTANNSFIITLVTIAVDLYKIFGNLINIVQRVGPIRMACQLHPLPARQVGKNRFPELFNPTFQSINFRLQDVIVGNPQLGSLQGLAHATKSALPSWQ